MIRAELQNIEEEKRAVQEEYENLLIGVIKKDK